MAIVTITLARRMILFRDLFCLVTGIRSHFLLSAFSIECRSQIHQNIITIEPHRKYGQDTFRMFRAAAVRQAEAVAVAGAGDVAILDDRGAHRAPLVRALVLNGINGTLDVDQQDLPARNGNNLFPEVGYFADFCDALHTNPLLVGNSSCANLPEKSHHRQSFLLYSAL